MINDKTIAYLLKMRMDRLGDNLKKLHGYNELLRFTDEEYSYYFTQMLDEVYAENNEYYPLPKGITDNDYSKYELFMKKSYECCYIGKDGNITDAGMFDLEDG